MESLKGVLQAEPTHFRKKPGKTLNSTISTHNNYNDLFCRIKLITNKKKKKTPSQFDTSMKEIHQQTK